ncbi:MAG: hypothetical protein D6705_07780 [Deltaproteobacteria bacterium]|nr:MAG: hypothetical protein D6705_07780 [Deltaproteobacteria bacterium]
MAPAILVALALAGAVPTSSAAHGEPRATGPAPAASVVPGQGPAAGDRYALAQRLAAATLAGTPADVDRVRRRIALGVPPEALAAVLGAMRASPRAAHADLAADLVTYRAPEVRGHALAVLLAVAPQRAGAAAERLVHDADPGVRRLARRVLDRLGGTRAAASVHDDGGVDLVVALDDMGEEPVDLVVDVDAVEGTDDSPPAPPVVHDERPAAPSLEPASDGPPGPIAAAVERPEVSPHETHR